MGYIAREMHFIIYINICSWHQTHIKSSWYNTRNHDPEKRLTLGRATIRICHQIQRLTGMHTDTINIDGPWAVGSILKGWQLDRQKYLSKQTWLFVDYVATATWIGNFCRHILEMSLIFGQVTCSKFNISRYCYKHFLSTYIHPTNHVFEN